jgi:hypothetical protein
MLNTKISAEDPLPPPEFLAIRLASPGDETEVLDEVSQIFATETLDRRGFLRAIAALPVLGLTGGGDSRAGAAGLDEIKTVSRERQFQAAAATAYFVSRTSATLDSGAALLVGALSYGLKDGSLPRNGAMEDYVTTLQKRITLASGNFQSAKKGSPIQAMLDTICAVCRQAEGPDKNLVRVLLTLLRNDSVRLWGTAGTISGSVDSTYMVSAAAGAAHRLQFGDFARAHFGNLAIASLIPQADSPQQTLSRIVSRIPGGRLLNGSDRNMMLCTLCI